MLFLLLLQGPGIEPCKSALKADTLTTDPLGTIYIRVEISRSDEAIEKPQQLFVDEVFFHAAGLFWYSTLSSKFVDSDATTMTFGESLDVCWLRKSTAFLLVLTPLRFFSTSGVKLSTYACLQLCWWIESHCFVATAAIFSIYFNYRGEAQPIGINLKHPLWHSLLTTGVLHY